MDEAKKFEGGGNCREKVMELSKSVKPFADHLRERDDAGLDRMVSEEAQEKIVKASEIFQKMAGGEELSEEELAEVIDLLGKGLDAFGKEERGGRFVEDTDSLDSLDGDLSEIGIKIEGLKETIPQGGKFAEIHEKLNYITNNLVPEKREFLAKQSDFARRYLEA